MQTKIGNQVIEYTAKNDSLSQSDILDIKNFLRIRKTKGVLVDKTGNSIGSWYVVNPKNKLIQEIEADIEFLQEKKKIAESFIKQSESKILELKEILIKHEIVNISNDVHFVNNDTGMAVIKIEFETVVTDYQMKVLIKHPFTFPGIKFDHKKGRFVAPSKIITIDMKLTK